MPNKMQKIMIRHKKIVVDTYILGVFMALSAALLFFFDLNGRVSPDPRVDFHELLILAVILGFGITWYGWRRITEQEREICRTLAAECHARFLAHHDPLTGLPNRRSLQNALDDLLAHPAAAGHAHALLLLDLIGFKTINDMHGHGRGDAVLIAVAARMVKTLRTGDLFARIGGDEFALVARNVRSDDGAVKVAAHLLEALIAPILIGTELHSVGTGIGVALVPANSVAADELMRQAYVALYHAKAQGSAAYSLYRKEMDSEARERERMLRDLGAAVQANEIVPFYQPIVDLDTGEVHAFEALARWTHPTDGPIPPDRFIPLAEESGIISALADRILQRACEDAKHWPAHIKLAVNISPLQLRDTTFALRLSHVLAGSGISPRRLELEITESAIARDLDMARDGLKLLRETGLRIVLDDFGTGATSLAHLSSFKFDGIKIDRRFVELMHVEAESATIVKAIIGLATSLGLSVVAEGIECFAQNAALRAEGCRLGQGYFFGRALSAERTASLFAAAARMTA